MTNKTHKSSYRVYYEDTDAGGIMYHGNFINFCERARSDLLRDIGLPASEITEKMGVGFVVRHLEAEYLRMVKLDELLTIETSLKKIKNTSFVMEQVIFNEEIGQNKAIFSSIFTMDVTLVCVDAQGKPVRIPEDLRNKFSVYLKEEN